MSEINIIIVDDHMIFRVGMEALLNSFENVNVIGCAENSTNLFKLLHKNDPDIIFMDVNLGNENGIDITRKVLASNSSILIIAITSSDEVNNFNEMLDAGASAFLLKNASEAELRKAIDAVITGENYFSKEFLYLAKQFNNSPIRKSTIQLSEREKEILQLICQGSSNQEIANTLELSIHTVDSHRRNLLSKTKANNTASLVMIAFKEGLVELDS